MKNQLKRLRADRAWTQEQLGARAGVSRFAINALETERHAPSLDLAFRLAAIFDLAVEEIFHSPHEVDHERHILVTGGSTRPGKATADRKAR